MRPSALFAVSVIALTPALAPALEAKSPGPDWTEANRTDELVIFTKDVEQGRKIVAVGEVDAPPEAVFDAVGDFEHYPEFMPYVKESRILSRKGSTELTTYQRLSPPLVSERDYCLKMTLTRGTPENGGVFKSEWVSKPQAQPETEGIVRVTLNEGSWLMEPLDGGKRTRLTYTLLTHPGGSIPNWIANKSNSSVIPDLFVAVKKHAKEMKKP